MFFVFVLADANPSQYIGTNTSQLKSKTVVKIADSGENMVSIDHDDDLSLGSSGGGETFIIVFGLLLFLQTEKVITHRPQPPANGYVSWSSRVAVHTTISLGLGR